MCVHIFRMGGVVVMVGGFKLLTILPITNFLMASKK